MAARVDPTRRRSGLATAGSGSRRFDLALERVRALTYRPEFSVVEAPGPARLAPHSYAQTVDVEVEGMPVGSGRLVILHDPVGQPSWNGSLRIVSYVDANIDMEVAADPMLPEVGWSWLLEALADSPVAAEAVGGTVTAVGSQSFGVMKDRAPEGRLQIRASWTPLSMDDLPDHAHAWALLVAFACGLPTNPDVAHLHN